MCWTLLRCAASMLEQMRRLALNVAHGVPRVPGPRGAAPPHSMCVAARRRESGRAVQTIYPDGRCELIAQLGGRHGSGMRWTAGTSRRNLVRRAARDGGAVRADAAARRRGRAAAAGGVGPALPRSRRAARPRRRSRGLDRGFSRRSTRPRARSSRKGRRPLWRLLARLCAAHRVDPKIECRGGAASSRATGRRASTRLRATAGLSMRSLPDPFPVAVGLSPKEFARLMRLQATLRALDGDAALADVAADRASPIRRTPRAKCGGSPASRPQDCARSCARSRRRCRDAAWRPHSCAAIRLDARHARGSGVMRDANGRATAAPDTSRTRARAR